MTVEVIGPDGIKYLEIRDGAFFSKAFLESMKALIRRFLELRRCEVTCDGQRPDPQGKACYGLLPRKSGRIPILAPVQRPQHIENVFGTVKVKYWNAGIPTNREAMLAQPGNV